MPSSAKLFSILSETRVPASVVDVRQKDEPLVFVNEAFETLTGYRSEEILGRNCRFLQEHEQNEHARWSIRKSMRDQTEAQIIFRNRTKSGAVFQNLLLLYPVFSETGVLTHYFGSQFDISQSGAETRFGSHARALDGAFGRIRATYGFDAVRSCQMISDAAYAVLTGKRAQAAL